MAYNQILKVTQVSKVPKKEIFAPDNTQVSAQNPQFKAPKNVRSTEESTGSEEPYVMINTVPIAGIQKMIIDETGTIPTIKITFIDVTGAISGPNYPKNDIVTGKQIGRAHV